MTDKISSRKGYIAAEFLNSTHRISGEVNLRNQPLVDTLNDTISTFVTGENIYISPIEEPATFIAQYPTGKLRKETISMVVVPREEDGLARHTIYHNATTQPITYNIFAVLPGFEVHGGVRLTAMLDVDNMLMQSIDRFITIYRATATVVNRPEVQFSGGAILLNRQQVTLFCIDKAAST